MNNERSNRAGAAGKRRDVRRNLLMDGQMQSGWNVAIIHKQELFINK